MKKWIIVCSVLCTVPAWAYNVKSTMSEQRLQEQGPQVRVLLHQHLPSALIEAKGRYQVLNYITGEVMSSDKGGKCFTVHAFPGGIRWGEEYPDCCILCIRPSNESTSFFVNGLQYKGNLFVIREKDQRITVINEVSLEEYLTCVLSLSSAPQRKESLAAWIILQRTAMNQLIKKRQKQGYDVVASDVQYMGYGLVKRMNGVDQEVENTRYMICDKEIHLADFTVERLESYAKEGLNAKEILHKFNPQLELSLTTPVPGKIIR